MRIFEFLVIDDERANTEEWKINIKNLKLETCCTMLETTAKDTTKFTQHIKKVCLILLALLTGKNDYKLCASKMYSAELSEWNFMDSFYRHFPYLKGPGPY